MNMSFLARIKRRLTPFFDLSAWVLLIISIVPLLFIDPAMAKTLMQWTLYSLSLAGISVVICRVVFPQIDLTEWLEKAREGEEGAAKIVSAVIIFLGFVFIGVVLWAKA